MTQKLYVGNLPYKMTEKDVQEMFSKYKPIHSAMLISNRETGLSRGFGFIELEKNNAEAAITELGDTFFGGRTIRISKAKERGWEVTEGLMGGPLENYPLIDPFV